MTKKTGYGLIALAHLAEVAEGHLASAREIAQKFGMSASLLMNVMKTLAAAGYVESVRGAHGGYRLACRPEEISLASLIETLEGPIRLAECVTARTGENTECTCQVMASCPIIDPVHRVQRKFSDFLHKLTLADILEPALSTE